MSLGVPERDILTEEISLHTLENVLASLLVLDREFHLHNIQRLLVVTTSYHICE
ncbi:MAG: ElyC/SanA/YdcF family protein [Bacillota bacterium]